MLKKLCSILLISIFALSAYAGNGGNLSGGMSKSMWGSMQGRMNETVLDKLQRLPGLTFYKNFTNPNQSSLNADFSLGSPTGTYTATRESTTPATYVDILGIMNKVTTSDIPRLLGGYYDEIECNSIRGLLIEKATANLIIRTDGTASGSGLWTGWTVADDSAASPTKTVVAIPELTSIPGATAQRIQLTGGAGDSGKYLTLTSSATANASIAAGNILTFSCYFKKGTLSTATNNRFNVSWRDAADAQISSATFVSALESYGANGWVRLSGSLTAPALSDHAKVLVYTGSINEGDVIDYQIALPQLEISQYATSPIPATTTALSRNAENFSDLNSSNSSDEETIFIKITPLVAATSLANTAYIYDTDGDSRCITIDPTTDLIQAFANVTDNAAVYASSTKKLAPNTEYILACVFKHSSPYVQIYLDGTSEGTYTVGDFTAPAYGTNFYLGRDSGGTATTYSSLVYKTIAKFNRAFSASEILSTTYILKNPTQYTSNTILALGDSITATWLKISNQAQFAGRYHMVGPFGTDPQNHGGVTGNKASDLLARTSTALTYMTGSKNVVLIHIGTNDWNTDTATYVGQVQDIIDLVNTYNPSTPVYVALVIPINDGAKNPGIIANNAALNTMLLAYQSTKSNLYIVDMYTTFTDNANWAADWMTDTLHPNTAGAAVISAKFASAMALNGD